MSPGPRISSSSSSGRTPVPLAAHPRRPRTSFFGLLLRSAHLLPARASPPPALLPPGPRTSSFGPRISSLGIVSRPAHLLLRQAAAAAAA
ncbi:hypothetical protein OC835_007757, partial [Tilletia horrida]